MYISKQKKIVHTVQFYWHTVYMFSHLRPKNCLYMSNKGKTVCKLFGKYTTDTSFIRTCFVVKVKMKKMHWMFSPIAHWILNKLKRIEFGQTFQSVYNFFLFSSFFTRNIILYSNAIKIILILILRKKYCLRQFYFCELFYLKKT